LDREDKLRTDNRLQYPATWRLKALYAIVIRTGEVAAMASSVLSVRLSDDERALLETASSQARTNVSDFVRRKAIEAAELEVMERRVVTIPAKDWARFEAWAAKPARVLPGLKALFAKPPTWRK
jgi:uncharacterized protein (DUF1778 family)